MSDPEVARLYGEEREARERLEAHGPCETCEHAWSAETMCAPGGVLYRAYLRAIDARVEAAAGAEEAREAGR